MDSKIFIGVSISKDCNYCQSSLLIKTKYQHITPKKIYIHCLDNCIYITTIKQDERKTKENWTGEDPYLYNYEYIG